MQRLTNIEQLDEWLDAWNTPEGDVIDLLGRMAPAEKARVIGGYRSRLAGCLNFDEMKRAVVNLRAPLQTQLEWLHAAATFGTTFMTWNEIKDLVVTASQSERDQLKTGRWKSFIIGVCTNATIIDCLTTLNFDLATQLTWIKGEASPLFSLDLNMLKPLLTGRQAAEIAAVRTDGWLEFWTDVCTNVTMEELAPILWPESAGHQLRLMEEEGTSADLVKKRLRATDALVRENVYDVPEALALIQGFDLGPRGEVVQIIGGPPDKQLSALGDDFPIERLNWAIPSQAWVDAVMSRRTDPLDVLRFVGSNAAWVPFLRPKLADVFNGNTAQAHGEDMVATVWAAYGDGSTFNQAQTWDVFRGLFGRTPAAPGDVIFNKGGAPPTRERYRAIDPDDATARELMRMVKTIPRSQVAISEIAFCDKKWNETQDPVTSTWSGPEQGFGSFFWMNRIVINAPVGPVTTQAGEAIAYGGEGTIGPGGSSYTDANALTFFQNHVRHEIGHAVGQRAIGDMSESGNEFASAYGGWESSSKATFLGSMWSAVAEPLSGWPSLDFGGGPVTVNDSQVRGWLVGLLETGAEVGGGNPISAGTDTPLTKLGTIAGSLWTGQELVKYLQAINRDDPVKIQDSAYMFPGYTPLDPVHIYGTRGGSEFKKYSKAAHDALHVTTGWYSLSSPNEMFAEIYTRKYSGGGTPPAVNGKDPAAFFDELERQEDPMFGEPDASASPGAVPGAGTAVEEEGREG